MVSLYDDALSCTCRHSLAVRRLSAKPSGRRVPSLGPWVAMLWRHIARVGNSLGVLGRVLLAGLHYQRADLSRPHTTERPPSGLLDAE